MTYLLSSFTITASPYSMYFPSSRGTFPFDCAVAQAIVRKRIYCRPLASECSQMISNRWSFYWHFYYKYINWFIFVSTNLTSNPTYGLGTSRSHLCLRIWLTITMCRQHVWQMPCLSIRQKVRFHTQLNEKTGVHVITNADYATGGCEDGCANAIKRDGLFTRTACCAKL